jgi:sugar phosphate isomerase/epimerase
MNEIPNLSITQITTFRWSLPDLVTHARDFGFPAIGLWMPRIGEFGEERAIDLILESGLEVSSLGTVGGFTGTHGHSWSDALLDASDALHLASRLGARTLTVLSGSRSSHTHKHARRLVRSALLELADEAADLHVDLTVKPMRKSCSSQWTFLHEFRDAARLVAECNHPAVKIAFGTWHLWDQPGIETQLERYAHLIGSVQLADGTPAPQGVEDQRLLGEGAIPFDSLLQPLRDAYYSGFFELDIWSPELWNLDYPNLLAHCRDQIARTATVKR